MNNVSVRVSVSPENERFTEAGQGPSLAHPTHFSLVLATAPEALSSTTSELLTLGAKGGVLDQYTANTLQGNG